MRSPMLFVACARRTETSWLHAHTAFARLVACVRDSVRSRAAHVWRMTSLEEILQYVALFNAILSAGTGLS